MRTNPRRVIDPGKLFSEDAIHWADLLSLIVYAQTPLRTHAKGIDCIVNVIRPTVNSAQMADFVFIPHFVRLPEVVWFPFAVSAEIRETLEIILPTLPSLEYPISDEIARDFINSFLALRNCPQWVPLLLQKVNLDLDEWKRQGNFVVEADNLENSIRKGIVTAFDDDHQPATRLWGEVFIDQVQAISYIRSKGLLSKINRIVDASKSSRNEYFRMDVSRKVPADFSPKTTKIPGLSGALLKYGISSAPPDWLANGDVKSSDFEKAIDTTEQVDDPETHPISSNNDHEEIIKSLEGDTLDDVSSHSKKEADSHLAKTNVSKAKVTMVGGQESSTGLTTRSDSVLLTIKEIMKIVKLGESSIYNRMNKHHQSFDPDFPKSSRDNGRNVWLAQEIDDYVKLTVKRGRRK